MKPLRYPEPFDKPIFAIGRDKEGREYLNAFSNIKSCSVISLEDKNIIVEGNPKIKLRIGESKFGNEMVFELIKTGGIKESAKRSKHDTVEIYLPLKFGLEFLKDTVKFFENEIRLREIRNEVEIKKKAVQDSEATHV